MLLILILIKEQERVTNINIILLLVLIITTLYNRKVLDGYKYMAQIARVVLNQAKPLEFRNNILNNKTYLKANDYQAFLENEYYEIFYKLTLTTNLKIFKNRSLKTIILIKNSNIDFYNETLHNDLEKLEESLIKEKKYHKHMILAFKEYKKLKDNDIKSIGEVVSYGIRKQHFTQINIGLNHDDKKAYFLYSDDYYPTRDYLELVEEIKKIII